MTWLTKRKFWLRLLLVVSAFFVLALLGVYLGRHSIISSMIRKGLDREFKPRNMEYTLAEIHVDGLHGLSINMLRVEDSLGQEFLTLDKLHVDYGFWAMLRKKPFLKELSLEGLHIDLNRLTPKARSEIPTGSPRESLLSKLQRAQRFLPEQNTVRRVSVKYTDSLGTSILSIDSAKGNLEHFTAAAGIRADSSQMPVFVNSSLKNGLQLDVSTSGQQVFPVLYQRTGLALQFDTLKIQIKPEQLGFLGIKSALGLDFIGLKIKHPKLSADTIAFLSLGLSGKYELNPQKLQLDSGILHCNGLKGDLAFQLPIPGNKGIYALHAQLPWTAATEYFSALPRGAFDDTRGIKADGELRYELRFILDESRPEDLVFESKLEKKDFRILSYPGRRLSFFNDTFSHPVFDEGRYVKTLRVHPDARNFTPLQEVNQHLIHAILCSEDPSFFQHRGFIMEAFRESILENYRSKSFKRGGSTISMQLVKNLFLNRNKTIFRKLEEALIVWLIEEQRLSSKERMMEVYLNIIEWGPGVYGIKDASDYYFQKKPADLTLQESIYLANIIPRPKKYYWAFEQDGSMKGYMVKLGNFIAKRMVKKEFLSPSDTVDFNARVQLEGRSAERFKTEEPELEIIDSSEFIPLSIPLD